MNKMKHIILCALFAALACVATLVIQIPSPATGGYVNLGDCLVLTAAFLLGPFGGALAAGIGSMMADLILGYAQYAPATFLIKAFMALIAGLLGRTVSLRCKPWILLGTRALAGLVAEMIMVLGYFAYEATLLGYGMGALASIPANLAQAAIGLVVSLLLVNILQKIPGISNKLPELNR